MSKITDKTELTSVASGDFIPIVDVSDTTANAAGTLKKVQAGTLGIDKDAWTSYTPTWTAISGNPSLGNGTLNGRYKKIGRTVYVEIFLLMGSTTTFGSSTYEFSVPFTMSTGSGTNRQALGSIYVEDASPSVAYIGVVRANSTTVVGAHVQSSTAYQASPLRSNLPITFAQGDYITMSFTYEAAS